MQPSDTAYPRFKSRLSPVELERFYTLTDAERIFCDGATRSDTTRLDFALLLKTYQRLGYFVTSIQVPKAIVEHIGAVIGASCERDILRSYDASQARGSKRRPAEFLNLSKWGVGKPARLSSRSDHQSDGVFRTTV